MLAAVTVASKAYPCLKHCHRIIQEKKCTGIILKDFFSESYVLNNPEVLH